jgi:hypothetical protein
LDVEPIAISIVVAVIFAIVTGLPQGELILIIEPYNASTYNMLDSDGNPSGTKVGTKLLEHCWLPPSRLKIA